MTAHEYISSVVWPGHLGAIASSISRVIPKHEPSGVPELEVTVQLCAIGHEPRVATFMVLSTISIEEASAAVRSALVELVSAELAEVESTTAATGMQAEPR